MKDQNISAVGVLVVWASMGVFGCGSNAPPPQAPSADAPRDASATSTASASNPNQRAFEAQCEASIKRRLAGHPTLDPRLIGVHVEGNRAELTGIVPSKQSAAEAKSLADSVPGIVQVESSLRVKEPVIPQIPDDVVHEQVRRRLDGTGLAAAKRLKVSVEDSRVTVRGTVASWDDYNRLMAAALDVTNLLDFDVDVTERAPEDTMPSADEVFGAKRSP